MIAYFVSPTVEHDDVWGVKNQKLTDRQPNYTERIRSWESDSASRSQEILRVLWNSESSWPCSQQPTTCSVLSQMNQTRVLQPQCFIIHVNIHLSMVRSSKWSLSFTFVHQILFAFYFSQAEIRFGEKSVSDMFLIQCPVFSPRFENDRKVCDVFPQSLLVRIVGVLRIRHGRFLPHPFQFTTHESSEHWTLQSGLQSDSLSMSRPETHAISWLWYLWLKCYVLRESQQQGMN